MKLPGGGVLCPSPLAPQHVREPPLMTAHPCVCPTARSMAWVAGGLTAPAGSPQHPRPPETRLPQAKGCPPPPAPQHTTLASVRTPQLWSPPAVTAVNVPAGAFVCPAPSSPQQAIVPSPFSAHEWLFPLLTWRNVPGGDASCPAELAPQHE